MLSCTKFAGSGLLALAASLGLLAGSAQAATGDSASANPGAVIAADVSTVVNGAAHALRPARLGFHPASLSDDIRWD
ncbi:hypothetical protein [Kitasatospora sp. NPDC050543]|uniref:hypothetical protein n=1 Tax=Kitasatospora sp. NPDC050543 TaxID=3364054 RepID=UPI0037AEAA30